MVNTQMYHTEGYNKVILRGRTGGVEWMCVSTFCVTKSELQSIKLIVFYRTRDFGLTE